jgi:type IX secretion system PorP/SprF family membrane protein
MKKHILTFLLLFVCINIYAQQDAMFTHYAFNTLAVNPGYAGSRDVLTITGLHRNQWVGIKGAPTSNTLTLHSPISKNAGLGLSVITDKIGPVKTNSVYADFAYRIKTSEKGRLSFGLKGGLNMMQANLTSLSLDQQDDIAFSSNLQSKVLPNFGFGLYYDHQNWYVGVSTPRMLENNFQTNEISGSNSIIFDQRHYYFIAGSIIKINDDLKLRPATFVKVTAGAPIEADLTAIFMLYDKVDLGAMYRTGDAFGLIAGFMVNDQMRIGYSYDYSYALSSYAYNGGSHEIMIRYDCIYKSRTKIRSPRYF